MNKNFITGFIIVVASVSIYAAAFFYFKKNETIVESPISMQKKTASEELANNETDILKKEEYGTLCPLKCVKDIIKENFLMVYGDNLYSVEDLKSFNIDDKYNYVAGFIHKHPEKYGVFVSDNGFLKEIIEKPKKYVGDLINTGLYKFTPEIFDKISQICKSSRGEYELTDAITLLAKEKKVKIKKIQDYWFDFGNPGDIIKVSKFLKNGLPNFSTNK